MSPDPLPGSGSPSAEEPAGRARPSVDPRRGAKGRQRHRRPRRLTRSRRPARRRLECRRGVRQQLRRLPERQPGRCQGRRRRRPARPGSCRRRPAGRPRTGHQPARPDLRFICVRPSGGADAGSRPQRPALGPGNAPSRRPSNDRTARRGCGGARPDFRRGQRRTCTRGAFLRPSLNLRMHLEATKQSDERLRQPLIEGLKNNMPQVLGVLSCRNPRTSTQHGSQQYRNGTGIGNPALVCEKPTVKAVSTWLIHNSMPAKRKPNPGEKNDKTF